MKAWEICTDRVSFRNPILFQIGIFRSAFPYHAILF